jgi:hypothetical protein
MLHQNFRESPKGEVRRILIPRTSVNKGKKEWQEVLYLLKDKRRSLIDPSEAPVNLWCMVKACCSVIEAMMSATILLRPRLRSRSLLLCSSLHGVTIVA